MHQTPSITSTFCSCNNMATLTSFHVLNHKSVYFSVLMILDAPACMATEIKTRNKASRSAAIILKLSHNVGCVGTFYKHDNIAGTRK